MGDRIMAICELTVGGLVHIPCPVACSGGIDYSLSVVQYSPKASAGVAYRKFAKELISYEG